MRIVGFGSNMRKLKAEYDQLKAHDFSLRFTYPTEAQRRHMRIVHRDLAPAEQRLAQGHEKDISKLVRDLEAGRLRLDSLDATVVEKLRTLIGG